MGVLLNITKEGNSHIHYYKDKPVEQYARQNNVTQKNKCYNYHDPRKLKLCFRNKQKKKISDYM